MSTDSPSNNYDSSHPEQGEQGELYKWVNGNRTPLPEIDDSDFPEKYAVRIKGDDPRSGWVWIGYETAEQMRTIKEDYWEWLCKLSFPPPEGQNEDIKTLKAEMKLLLGDIMANTRMSIQLAQKCIDFKDKLI